MRPADFKPAGGIDIELDVTLVQFRRQFRQDDVILDELFDLGVADFRSVLCRNHDRIDSHGFVAIELDRHLALAIGPEPIHFFLEASFCQSIGDTVS